MNWRAAFVATDPRPSMVEIVLASTVALIGVLQSFVDQLGAPIGWLVVYAIGAGVAVLLARASPLPAAALLCMVIIASGLSGVIPDNSIAEVVATIIVTYVISAWAPLWFALGATITIVASIVLTPMHSLIDIMWESILMALPFIAGQAMRRYRRVVRSLEAATAELEQSRLERAAAAATAERMRVAREVHDIVAHGVSVMVVQAGAAETMIETDASAAKKSLAAIQTTGRQALSELRGLLGTLRAPDGAVAERAPHRGLDDIDELAARFAHSGLRVSVDRGITGAKLNDSTDLIVYRVVQESLTNALKHGGEGTAAVSICCDTNGVEVTILNKPDRSVSVSRPHSADQAVGHGLEGMRERVTSSGGSLTTSRLNGAAFSVTARIPFEDHP